MMNELRNIRKNQDCLMSSLENRVLNSTCTPQSTKPSVTTRQLTNLLQTSTHKPSVTAHMLNALRLTFQVSYNTLKTPLLTKTKCLRNYTLLIMATTRAESVDRRSAIRSTWGNGWHKRRDLPLWKTVFQLGQSDNAQVRKNAEREAANFKDMIFGDFQDVFYNLPIKVVMGFEWATTFCDFEFLLKVDDDVAVHMPNIFQFFKKPNISKFKLYAGNVPVHKTVVREKSSKYYVNSKEYPQSNYPDFCSGGGFLLSRDVAASMVDNHNNSDYFKLDDVYIGMLALRLGINARHDNKFLKVIWGKSCPCHERNKEIIITHPANTARCQQNMYNCNP